MVDGECIVRGARHDDSRGGDAGIPVQDRPVDRATPGAVVALGRIAFHVQPPAGSRVAQLGTGEGSIRGRVPRHRVPVHVAFGFLYQWAGIRDEVAPWWGENSAQAYNDAAQKLSKAFTNFRQGRAGFPWFVSFMVVVQRPDPVPARAPAGRTSGT